MPITINDSLQNNSPKPVDQKYMNGTTPWASVAAANAGILAAYRHPGLTVLIDDGSGRKEYWYKNGTSNGDLVEKQVAGGGGSSKFEDVDASFISPIDEKGIEFNSYSNDGQVMRWVPSNFGADYGVMGKAGSFNTGWDEFPGVNPSGRPNVVAKLIGYNDENGGLPGEPQFAMRLETHFELGPSIMFEFHLPEVKLGDGITRRVWSMYVQKDGSIPGSWSSESHGIGFTRWDGSGKFWGGLQPGRLTIMTAEDTEGIEEIIMAGGGTPTAREFRIRRFGNDFTTEIGHSGAHTVAGNGDPALNEWVPKTFFSDNVTIGTEDAGQRRSLTVNGGTLNINSTGDWAPMYVTQKHATQMSIAEFGTVAAGTITRLRRDRLDVKQDVFVGDFGSIGYEDKAALQIHSTTKGFLPPRMTGAQIEAMGGVPEGLMAYATAGNGVGVTSKGWWGFDGTNWVKLN